MSNDGNQGIDKAGSTVVFTYCLSFGLGFGFFFFRQTLSFLTNAQSFGL